MTAELHSVAPVSDFYLYYEYQIASAQLILAMLGMGATLRPADFGEIARDPRGFAFGLVAVLLAGPLLALGVASVFQLEPGIATGLVLIAAVPGGTLSNILTYLAHGNVALSIALTGAATLSSLVTTPLVLSLFASGLAGSDVEMPVGRIAIDIGAFLLVPLALGMAIGNRLDEKRDAFTRACIRASLAVIVVMVVGAASAGRVNAGAYGATVLLAMACFCILLLATGLALGLLARLPRNDVVTIGIEASYRNTSLALLVKASVFPVAAGVADPFADQVLFVALLYAGIALFVSIPPLLFNRRRAKAASP